MASVIPMPKIQLLTLTDWAGNVDPYCVSPSCDRVIHNGDRYLILPESNLILCENCAKDATAWHLTYTARRPDIVTKSALHIDVRKVLETLPPEIRPKPKRYVPPRPPRPKPVPPVRPPIERGDCPICGKSFPKKVRADRNRVQETCSMSCARKLYYQKQRGEKIEAQLNPPVLNIPNPWAQNYACCVDCGTTTRAHRARGKCTQCYQAEWLVRPPAQNSPRNVLR